MVKNLSNNAGDVRRGFDPMGQENPMDSRGCWTTVHIVAQSQTQLKQLITHACILFFKESFTVSQELRVFFFFLFKVMKKNSRKERGRVSIC